MPGMVSLPHGAIMKPILQILRKPWVRTVLAVPLVYGLIGFLGLPWLVRHQLPPRVGQLLQRPLSIGAVNFNPFLLRLELRDTTLTEGDGQPLFALQRLLIDFELLDTLRNRAPTFAELRLERPMLQLVQEPDGTLNLSRLIDDLPDVAQLVRRLQEEYVAACALPDMADAARAALARHGADADA